MTAAAAVAAGSLTGQSGRGLIVARVADYHSEYDGPTYRVGEKTRTYAAGRTKWHTSTWHDDRDRQYRAERGLEPLPEYSRVESGEHCLIGAAAREEAVEYYRAQLDSLRSRTRQDERSAKAARTRARNASGLLASGKPAKDLAQYRAKRAAEDAARVAESLSEAEAQARDFLTPAELAAVGLGETVVRAAQPARPTGGAVVAAGGANAWLWVSGNTYPNRDAIKACGGRWSGKRQAWYIMACSETPAALASLPGLEFQISGGAQGVAHGRS